MTINKIIKHPLSSPQRDIWFYQLLYPDMPLYNVGGYLQIDGPIEMTVFEQALNQVIQDNDALRIILHQGETLPVQEFLENVHVSVACHDFSEQNNAHTVAQVWMEQEFAKPFSLDDELLCQFALCKISTRCYYWFQKYHHLIVDRWSISLVIQRVAEVYNAQLTGKSFEKPNPHAYLTFVKHDQAYLNSETFGQHERYWLEKYQSKPEPLIVPHSIKEQPITSQRASLSIKPDFYHRLTEFTKANNTSLFQIILGALYCYFVRTGLREDLAIGLSTPNRNTAAFKQTIGPFANISPAWFRLGTDLNGVELLKAIDLELQHNDNNQAFPLTELNQRVSLHQESRKQLFDITLSYVKYPDDVHFNGNPTRLVYLTNGFQANALSVLLEEFPQSESVNLHFDYNLRAFSEEEMALIKARVEFILDEMINKPLVPIRHLQIMPDAELKQILYEFNDTAADYPLDKCIHHLFEEQVEQNPKTIAVVFEEQSLSYATLNQKANQLAHHLQTLGVKPEVLVGICVERSLEMVIGLLGILKAGGAYVPLDPAYPTARLAFMLEDAKVSVLLTQSSLVEHLPETTNTLVVCLDVETKSQYSSENLSSEVTPSNLAYVIYTSGSTGQPKGVAMEQGSLVNLIEWQKKYSIAGYETKTLQFSPISFDVSFQEIFSTWYSGGTLVLISEELRKDVQALLNILSEHAIERLFLPFVALQHLAEMACNSKELQFSLREVITAGEQLQITPSIANWFKHLTGCTLHNHYGPSESHVVTSFTLTGSVTDWPILPPIGHPIANAQIYILDTHLQPVPIGVSGELHIGGASLARGYLKHSELTQEKFIKNGFSEIPSTVLYKTGDLARYLPDGTIEFLGRFDNQVKIRGFRIELGEIESILAQHPAVQKTAVIVHEKSADNKQLVAYIVPNQINSSFNQNEAENEQHTQWQQILWDSTYSQATLESTISNTVGWNDSYTGAPIPREEMLELINWSVEQILAWHPKRVLEMGCGTGMLLFRIAPHCDHYVATDISSEALRYIEQQMEQQTWPQVTLEQRTADDFEGIEPASYDAVIFNGVLQCFSGIDYLLEVLAAAIKVVAPGGLIFIGDISSLTLRKAYHTSVQLHKAPASMSLLQLRQRIQSSMSKDEHLRVDPDFFIALKQHFPPISQVQIQLKRGKAHNEITHFHYDAILHIECENTLSSEFQTVDWQTENWDLSKAHQMLVDKQPSLIGFKNVPNARVQPAVKLVEWLLQNQDDTITTGDLRDMIKPQKKGVEPEDFWALSKDLPYATYISWSKDANNGCYDVVFQRASSEPVTYGILPQFETSHQKRPWHSYVNHPLQDNFTHNLLNPLRDFLKENLPEYMIPSALVPLETMPLTPSGKIDRRALSQLPVSYQLSEETLVVPRTPDEEQLAQIWREVLGIEQVGIHDNFFELGGHSLLATQVISKIRDRFSCELPLHDLFESPTIAQLSEHLEFTDSEKQLPSIIPLDRNQPLPLSFAQQGLWFLDQLEGEYAIAYNESWALLLEGSLHQTALEQSLQEIVQRHEVLRTSFPMVDGKPVLKIHPFSQNGFNLAVIDLQNLSNQKREGEEQRLFRAEVQRPFNLSQGPLFRAMLISRTVDTYVLLLNMHHIIFDGWSQALFIEELSKCYDAFSQNQLPSLPPLAIQYVDFANWQWLNGERLEKQVDYWKQQLAGAPTLLQLPTDFPRPAMQRSQGASSLIHISAEFTEQLQSLSNQTGATLFMTLLSGFAVLLARYSGQSDIVIGSPIANRTHSQTESLIGFFINTLALRLDLSGNPSFETVLQQARRVALEAYDHQDLPFEQLVEELKPERNLSHSPLFQVMLELQDAPLSNLELSGLTVTQLELNSMNAKFDLTLLLEKTTQGLVGKLEYNTDLFKASSVERLNEHFKKLLDGVVKNPFKPIYELPLLTETEQQQLMAWNDTATDYPKDQTIVDLFEQQVEKTPNNIAVIFEDQQLSYWQLNEKANQLAHYLLSINSQEGTVLLSNNSLIAIAVERSVEMVISLLAILKVGGAYVPIDPSYPQTRIRYMLDDSTAPLLLTQSHLKAQLSLDELEHDCVVVCLDDGVFANQSIENPQVNRFATDLAYVIYTSGSTGMPKGVAIEHSSPAQLINWADKIFDSAQLAGVLASTSICFDLSIFELFVPLSHGGGVIVVEDALQLQKINQTLLPITLLNTVPSVATALLNAAAIPSSIQVINLAGEPLKNDLAQALYKTTSVQKIYNLYGPSEDTTYSTFTCVARDSTTEPTIGIPIVNTRIYILNAQHQPQPPGIPGELCIAGSGLARGYLNRPEQTAEKFIEVELFGKTERIYKTGDLARWRADGNLEYLGRIDHQVKLRGFRIELGEIESMLATHPFVQENVVIVHETESFDKRLVAYIVPNQGQIIDNQALRTFLTEQMPDYMIPSVFVTKESLPLTPNGKIDRKTLEQLPLDNWKDSEETFIAPRDSIELQLVQIWEDVLNVRPIGVRDNFFELGGHSLLAVRLMAQIGQQLNKHLPLATLFQGATIEQLATLLQKQTDDSTFWSSLVPIQSKGSKPPFFCVPGVGGHVLYFYELARELGKEQPFYALQPVGLDGKNVPHTCVEDMAAHYIRELQTIQPQGPYLLGGHSFGGLVAFEMSQQLQQQGQVVALLALFDSVVPRYFNEQKRVDWTDARWLIEIAHFIEQISGIRLDFTEETLCSLAPDEQLKYFHEQLKKAHFLPQGTDIKLVRGLVQVFKAQLQTHYAPTAKIPHIVLFRASEPIPEKSHTETMATDEPLSNSYWNWNQFAENPVTVHWVAGNHFNMMNPPHVLVLAEQLKLCFEQSH